MAEHWVIPCNTRFFDVIAHFQNSPTVVWRNAFTIRKGDIAYLYLSSPFGEIRYKCVVVCDDVDDELLQKNKYAIPPQKYNNYYSKRDKYIQLKLEREYPSGILKFSELREHGLGQVQIQARTNRKLQTYIDRVEHSLDTRC